MADVIDSYSESNQDSYYYLNATYTRMGQSFTATAKKLGEVKFYLKKYGSPTGNAVAKIYSHSGTYGTSSLPNTLLATSDNLDVSTLSASSFGLKTFTFSGENQIDLSSAYYVVTVEYSNGNANNYIYVGCDGSSPSHSGNGVNYSTSWGSMPSYDICFYVYTAGASKTCTETVTCVDSNPHSVSVNKTETLTLSEIFVRGVSRAINDVVILGDGIQKTFTRILSDVLTFFDSVANTLSKMQVLIETVVITDVVSRAVSRAIQEVITIWDTINSVISRIFTEMFSLIDLVFYSTTIQRVLSEMVSLSDSILGVIKKMWTKQAKPTSSWTKQAKPTSSWTKQ